MESAINFEGSTEKLLHELAEKIGDTFSDPEYRSIFFLIVSEGKRFPKLVKFYFDEVITPSVSRLSNIIQRGVDRGDIKSSISEEDALLLLSPVIFINVWNRLFGNEKKINLKDTLHSHIDIWLDGMRPENK